MSMFKFSTDCPKLPLSFMSSVFGMNNSTIGSDKMTFGDQANFICMYQFLIPPRLKISADIRP